MIDKRKITNEQIEKMIEKQGGLCAVCIQPLTGGVYGWTGFGVHHIQKRSQGGNNDKENLVLTHNFCNVRLEDRPDLAKSFNLVKSRSNENIRFSKKSLGREQTS